MPEETKEPLQVSKLREYYGEELYTLAQFISRHLLLATINKRISGQVGSVSTLHVLMSCSIFFYFYLFWVVSSLSWKNLKLNSSEYHSAGKVTFHLSNLTGICFLFQKWWGSKSYHYWYRFLWLSSSLRPYFSHVPDTYHDTDTVPQYRKISTSQVKVELTALLNTKAMFSYTQIPFTVRIVTDTSDFPPTAVI